MVFLGRSFCLQTQSENLHLGFEVNKGRYFRESGEFQLMAGPFVAALEYATGRWVGRVFLRKRR